MILEGSGIIKRMLPVSYKKHPIIVSYEMCQTEPSLFTRKCVFQNRPQKHKNVFFGTVPIYTLSPLTVTSVPVSTPSHSWNISSNQSVLMGRAK